MSNGLRNVADFYPLSPMQQGMLYHTLAQPGSDVYCQQATCRIEGALDEVAFRQAWEFVLQAHDVLRTSFVWHGLDEPVQVVHVSVRSPVEVIDGTDLDAEARARRVRDLLIEERRSGFDLRRPPLMRVRLVRLGDRERRLVWTYHHILLDGMSANRVLTQVLETYGSLARGAEPRPLPSHSYREYVGWHRRQDHVAAKRFWQERLRGFVRPNPPLADRDGVDVDPEVAGVATEVLTLTAATSETLAGCARRERVTLNTLIQGAWGLTLAAYSGADEVALGATVSVRPPDLEGVDDGVGLYINTLPVRVRADDPTPVATWLRRQQAIQADSRQYDFCPLAEIQSWADVPGESGLFDAILVFGNYGGENPLQRVPSELRIRDYEGWESSSYPLNAYAEPGARLRLGLVYDLRRFTAGTARRLLEGWRDRLESMTSSPDTAVAALPLAGPTEARRVLVEWNDTHAEVADRCLHEDVLRAIDDRSEEPVVVFPGGEMTGGRIADLSRRIARRLAAAGAGPGDHVGIFLGRHPTTLAALLGVLQSGAAFVPLDPGWPRRRSGKIIESLAMRAVISSREYSRQLHDALGALAGTLEVVYLDVAEPLPPAEILDEGSVTAFWDHLAESAAGVATAAGFTTSTGEPFSEAEVREYVDRVVELATRDLPAGARVLEIGCGPGLILSALAPRVARYYALDPSPRMQERNRARLGEEPIAGVELLVGFAGDSDGWPGDLDLVLLSSTAQFFPGPAYLEHVIRSALGRLVPGGLLLLCDLLDPARREEAGSAGGVTGAQTDAGLHIGPALLEAIVARCDLADSFTVMRRRQGFDNELGLRWDAEIRRVPAGSAAAGIARACGLTTLWHLRDGPAPEVQVQPSDVAYVVYTSGSTGEPKGVAVSHRAAVNLVDWVNRTFEIGPRDRILWTTALTFDLAIYDLLGVAAAGGSVRIATEEELAEPERLARILIEEPVTFWDSAPAALARLLPALRRQEPTSGALRLVFLSGDWIPVDLPGKTRRWFPGARVVALGGATEATIWSNYHVVDEVPGHWRSIPYGRPIQNARYYVLGSSMRASPVGAPGELYIGGACLAEGYSGAPAATAARFVPDPFSARGERLYRTGDRARFLPDGEIEFLGRVDRQMKVRGFRIEPAEIEHALQRHVAVRRSVVRPWDVAAGDRRLVAYVVPERGVPRPGADELEALVAEYVPAYMVPAHVVFLEELPLTANGKVDLAALPPPSREGTAGSAVAPKSSLERRIAAVWCDVLGVARVGRDESFFELGGHSLLLIRLHARLLDALQADLRIVDLFRFPTVGALAAHLEGAARETDRRGSERPAASGSRASSRARRLRARRGVSGESS